MCSVQEHQLLWYLHNHIFLNQIGTDCQSKDWERHKLECFPSARLEERLITPTKLPDVTNPEERPRPKSPDETKSEQRPATRAKLSNDTKPVQQGSSAESAIVLSDSD
jgi:hypothetical protein